MLTERLTALDAFRGATIAFMVLVNDAGDGHNVYAPLRHAEWNGWTPTDVVFPSFLFIMGAALTLSLAKRQASGVPRSTLFGQALKRAAILYILGLIVYAAPAFNPATWRLLGVLQRIAICYLAAVAITLTTGLKGRVAWLISLLTTYWLLMTLVPVPGYGPGRLDVEGNFAHYIDRIVLGAHNYRSTKTWDPEGIVSTLPAIGTALLGVLCGQLLQLKNKLSQKLMWMLLVGVILIAAGETANIWMPINKKLWTPAFTFFMAGLDFILLSVFLWLIDGLGYKRAVKPLVIIGLNPIAIYMLSELLDEALGYTGLHRTIYKVVFQPLASPINASLLWALAYTALMCAAAWILHRRKLILRV
jgi:predicted acyltransferase